MKDKKLDFKGRLKIVRQGNMPKEIENKEMTQEEFNEYMEALRKRRIENLSHIKSIESARFLGKHAKYIVEALKEEALAPSLSVVEILPAALGENLGDYAALSLAADKH